jgi:hypothetical protein
MNRFPALRGGPSNTLSVIDPPASISGQPPGLRVSFLGSSCQCAMPAQDPGTPSDRVSAGSVLALLEHRSALNQAAARTNALLPPQPAIAVGLRDVGFRSGLATSVLAARGAISLGKARRGAAGRGPRRDVSQRNASQRYGELIRGVAYRVYRPYWPHRNGRRSRGRGARDRRSQ